MSDESISSLVKDIDWEMSKKSFSYFFQDILGFDFSEHHQKWEKGLNENRYYVVKASRDHGKSTLFMSYAL